jgi:hypothetical protein
MAAKDPNSAEKGRIKARVSKSKNTKVKKYLPDFLEKIDQLGPAAGIWLESLETDFDTLTKKPEGLLASFSSKDFDELFEVIFGYEREGKKASVSDDLTSRWFQRD